MTVLELLPGRQAAGRRARLARRGFTLVETLVAVMLISVVVTSVFSLVLTARMTSTKSDRKAQAVFYVRKTMEALKAYVRADPNAPAPSAAWHLNGDATGGWALAAGQHDVSNWLSGSFCKLDPANCRLTYTVVDVACGAVPCTNTDRTCCKQVSVNIVYKDAQ